MRRVIYIILMLILFLPGYGQYSLIPSLSNFHLTWTTFNPGFTGYRELGSISSFYRYKMYWNDGPADLQINAHTPLRNGSEAVGVIISNSRITDENRDLLTGISSFMGTYAHRFRVGGGRLSLGLSAGLYMIREDHTNISLRVSPDPAFQADNRYAMIFPNFGVGGVYYNKTLFFGFSIPELLSVPDDYNGFSVGGVDINKYRFIVTGAYLFTFSDNLNMKPALMVDYNRANTTFKGSLNFGILNNMFFVGGAYHHPNYVVALLNLPLKQEKYMVGLAWTFPVSEISGYYRWGTAEIVFRYEFRKFNKTPYPNPFYF